MGSLVIVVPQPSGEYSLATGGGLVGFSAGPSALQRLDEALRFAVGARCVGPRPEVSDSERVDGVSKEPGDEGRAVVRHDAAGADALAAIPGDDPVGHAHAKDVAPLLISIIGSWRLRTVT